MFVDGRYFCIKAIFEVDSMDCYDCTYIIHKAKFLISHSQNIIKYTDVILLECSVRCSHVNSKKPFSYEILTKLNSFETSSVGELRVNIDPFYLLQYIASFGILIHLI